jgi:hypothetical protein
MGRAAAGYSSSLCPIEGDATPGSIASSCQLNGENPAQGKRKKLGWPGLTAQRKPAGGGSRESETRPNPGRGGRDLREKKTESSCVACCKDKKKGVPPKTRWKEEQKEKTRSQEAQGKENRAVAMSSPGRATVVPVAEGSETQRALKETQKDAESSKGENTQTPVACVT